MDLIKLTAELKRHEGLRLRPYTDTTGHITIGYGRNLSERGIDLEEAEYLLGRDIHKVVARLESFDWFTKLNEVRQRAVANMVFNLGWGGFLEFHDTLKAIRDSRFSDAAQCMMQSKWAEQVGGRAQRLARMIETGEDV